MKILLILLGLFILVVIGAGALLLPKLMEIRPHVWQTAKVDSGDIQVVATATGSVEPTSTVKVGSLVSGKVKDVLVAQDDRVTKGQIIAVLDTELMENERKEKDIAWRQAKSNKLALEVEEAQLDLREERLRQSRERDKVTCEKIKASFDLAVKMQQRYADMRKADATTESEWEIKVLEKENAEREVQLKAIESKTLDTDLKEIAASRRALKSKVAQTELAIEQAEEAVKRAVTNLSYAKIVSPIDGVVFEKTVDIGQTLAAQFQSPDLFKIAADLSRVNINASIDEVDISRVRIGQKVRFEVDTWRGEKFTGIVKTIHLKFEGKANLISYPVVIEAENPTTPDLPNGKLLPGMTAFLEFDVEKRKGVTRIPAGALAFNPPADVLAMIAVENMKSGADKKEEKKDDEEKKEGDAEKPKLKGTPATVYIKDAQNKLKPVKIRVTNTDGKFYELLSGDLKPGDEVVVSTPDQQAPGQTTAAPAAE